MIRKLRLVEFQRKQQSREPCRQCNRRHSRPAGTDYHRSRSESAPRVHIFKGTVSAGLDRSCTGPVAVSLEALADLTLALTHSEVLCLLALLYRRPGDNLSSGNRNMKHYGMLNDPDMILTSCKLES